MRFDELHLKAFGGFDDYRIDLAGGDYGLHLVYGPNEAGKSTTLRAITQLLYGIPARTGDDFLHAMKNLRIGATIRNERASLRFYRRKGNKGTLLAEDEKSKLPEDALQPFLGPVDEEAFAHLFGLSHEALVAGGEALIQGEGDVGQALFSAAAGLGNLRDVLARLDGDAGALFKPNASKPRINEALSEYRKLRKAVKDVQVLPKEWADQSARLAEMQREREEVQTSLQDLLAEGSRLERAQKALPLIAERADLLERIEALGEVTALPASFGDRRLTATHDLAAAREQQQVAETNLARVEEQLDALDVNEALLQQAGTIKSLFGRHEVNRKAQDDKNRELLPKLERHRDHAERLLRDLDVDREAVEALRPAPGLSRRINELVNEQQSVEKDGEHARDRHAKLARERDACAKRLAEMGKISDPAPLARAIKDAQTLVAAPAEIAKRTAAVKRLEKQNMDALRRLTIAPELADQLESVPVPNAARIEAMRLQMERESAEAKRWADECENLEAERARVETELETLRRTQTVPTESVLQSERKRRDEAWQIARAAWEQGIAPGDVDAEDAMQLLAALAAAETPARTIADAVSLLTEAADETADRLRRESDRVAQRAGLEARHATLEAQLADLETVRRDGEARHEATGDEWVALWRPLAIVPGSPAEMAEWHAGYTSLLADRAQLVEEADTLADLERRVAHHADALRALLAADGATPDSGDDLTALLAAAESRLAAMQDTRAEIDGLAKAHAQHEAELADLALALERVDGKRAEWREAWGDVMARIGAPAEYSAAEALARLEGLEAYFTSLDDAAELEARVTRIDEEYAAYLEAVEALAAAAGSDEPLETLVPILFEMLESQQQQATARANLLERRTELQESLTESEAALERAENELADLQAIAGVNDVSELEQAEARSRAYDGLVADQRALEARLLDLSPGLALEPFLEQVADVEPEAIPGRLSTIEAECAALEERRDALLKAIVEAENELAQMDGSETAAALANDAERVLAGMAEDVRRYAQLRVAHLVLNEAIERYREANQEPLLARAGEYFRDLTLGSFEELRADYDDKGQLVLCGYRPGNEAAVYVPGMSEGTADQLYLALRLASLERHLDSHAPIPFILDDILVNFDDARAVATLKALAELSKRTQVIYFTHHAHLVALAKKHVKKNLFTHDLESRS